MYVHLSTLKTTQTSTQTPGPNTRGTHDAHIRTGTHAITSRQPQPPFRGDPTLSNRPTDARLGVHGDGGGPIGLEAHEIRQLSHLGHVPALLARPERLPGADGRPRHSNEGDAQRQPLWGSSVGFRE